MSSTDFAEAMELSSVPEEDFSAYCQAAVFADKPADSALLHFARVLNAPRVIQAAILERIGTGLMEL